MLDIHSVKQGGRIYITIIKKRFEKFVCPSGFNGVITKMFHVNRIRT